MPYRDSIPDPIGEKILSWGLSTTVLKALMDRLRKELHTRSVEEYSGRIAAPVRYLVLRLTIMDPDTEEPRDFVFWIDYMTDPGVRIVIECADCSMPLIGQPTGRTMPVDSE